MGFFGKDEDEQIRSYERSLARAKEEKETLEVKNRELELKISEANKSNEQLKQAMEEIKEQFDSFKQQTLKEKEELQAKLKGEKLIKKNVKDVLIQFRCTPQQKNKWISQAEKEDISLSKFIKEALSNYKTITK